MNIYEILTQLVAAKYSILLIAEASNVPYMRVYRAYKDGAKLTQQEEGRIRAFAFVQPVFTNQL